MTAILDRSLATAIPSASPTSIPPLLEDVELRLYSDALDDIEAIRIATENRARALRLDFDLAGSAPEQRMVGVAEGLAALEHGLELDLRRALRRHPLGPWVRRTVGVGEKQGARLLVAIGDPAARSTVSQLWAYCGLHVWHLDHNIAAAHPSFVEVPVSAGDQRRNDTQSSSVASTSDPGQRLNGTHSPPAGVAPHRRRGQRANWNATAKMRAFLVAESCIKHMVSPYRAVYEAGRAKYAEAAHPSPCVRCGPKGSPAGAGSPLSAGHQHARALRLVMKAVLRDLWREAKRLQEAS